MDAPEVLYIASGGQGRLSDLVAIFWAEEYEVCSELVFHSATLLTRAWHYHRGWDRGMRLVGE